MVNKTIRSKRLGNTRIRLVKQSDQSFVGIVILEDRIVKKIHGSQGETEDEVWSRLKNAAQNSSPSFFGYDGARARFLSYFPNGFEDERYLEMERNYKSEAKSMLDDLIPVETALNGNGLGEKAFQVFKKTNLLSIFEKMKVKDVLLSEQGDKFVRGSAEFALQDPISGLRKMASALKPHYAAKWTVVTYLPFLWKPEDHIFLKPGVTKSFAESVGHEFALRYKSFLEIDTYESLQDLAAKTKRELSGMNPRDGIDIQSFIWVVGKYPDTISPQGLDDELTSDIP